MLQPAKASIVLYAEDEQELKELEATFYEFVNEKRTQGIAVSAKKLTKALNMFKNNIYVNNFLKQ